MEQQQARFLILWIARVEGVAGFLPQTQKHLRIQALKGRVLRFVTLVGRVVNLSLASVSMKKKVAAIILDILDLTCCEFHWLLYQ